MSYVLTLIACLICYKAGWVNAHKTVAKECKRLGKFYVGKEVFQCTQVEEVHK